MKFKIFWYKLWIGITVFFSGAVWNFHKKLANIDTVKKLNYANDKAKFHRLEMYFPSNKKDGKLLPIIFYFHGGGWLSLDKSMYRTLCRRLASFGYIVFNCNYKLAPKNNMIGIIDDCLHAIDFGLRFSKDYKGDSNNIVLAGDSAGAHIASYLTSLAQNNKINRYDLKDKIKANLLFYGVYDFVSVAKSNFNKIDLMLGSIFDFSKKDIVDQMKKYSTLTLLTENFVPTLIASGKIDKLHESQSKRLGEKLDELKIYNEKIYFEEKDELARHGFMSVDKLPTNKKVLSKIPNFLHNVFDDKVVKDD